MEDATSAEARAWISVQGAYARATLDALPKGAALLTRIAALSGAMPHLTHLRVAAGRTFYRLREPRDDLPKLIMRGLPQAPAWTLLDPNRIAGDTFTTIDWYYPSPDGRLVACGLSQSGS